MSGTTLTRDDVTRLIVAARVAQGLRWADLAEAIGRPPVWTTAALLGQHPLPAEAAATIVERLGLPEEAAPVLQTVPYRGPGEVGTPPSDPTIYRFHEALAVYGPALKELIHEQFGDGIMSAINFSVELDRRPHESGDRVVVTFDGKFLPYDWVSADLQD